jgi:outer membrane protein assembly factor BamB
MWRCDAGHTAASADDLPGELHLQWTRQYSQREPVWDDPLNRDMMPYDRIFEPVVADGKMFLGFNDTDKVVALDVRDGSEVWTFFADGPVRFSPIVYGDSVLFSSDDGYLYCVGASDGRLRWRFRGGPSERKIIGNRRVISSWPSRGGPVVADDTVYFSAGIWPFMGTLIYALDARTGDVRWLNDDTSRQFQKQPHSAPSFAGVAPQGQLAVSGDLLLVPGGRSLPAAFERASGKLKFFDFGGKGQGGSFVAAGGGRAMVHTRKRGTMAIRLPDGGDAKFQVNEPVLDGQILYAASGARETKDAESPPRIEAYGPDDKRIWQIDVDAGGDLIKAGSRLYAAGSGRITAVLLPAEDTAAKVAWSIPVEGEVLRLVAASGRLYAVTLDGRILAYGERPGEPKTIALRPQPLPPTPEANDQAERLLAATGQREGYALWFGVEDGALLEAVAISSQLHIVAVDSNAEKVERLRRRLDQAGLYGRRITLHTGNPETFMAPPYIANLVVVGRSLAASLAQQQRPIDTGGSGQPSATGVSPVLNPGATGVSPVPTPGATGVSPVLNPGATGVSPVPNQQHGQDAQGPGHSSHNTTLGRIYESVRPYGGTLWIQAAPAGEEALAAQLPIAELANAELDTADGAVVISREGALPGAADWTHAYGDVANSVKSDDRRVRLPLGLLWFGGSSNLDVLPRHGHGPSEQVTGGRLFIEGMNCLSARDVYTGRVLWKREFKDLGTFQVYFDESYEDTPLSTQYNQLHIPGANARGTNYVATTDGVYMVLRDRCVLLDSASGETLRQFVLPADSEGRSPRWGYVGVYEDLLLAGVEFGDYSERMGYEYAAAKKRGLAWSPDHSGSLALWAFDRQSGKVAWKVAARHSFLHNGIVAGGGRVYLLDKLPKRVEEQIRRRGGEELPAYRFLAVDAATGETIWTRDDVFGTWLGYSKDHDVLLQAGAAASDRSPDEAGAGMAVYRAADGTPLWKNDDLAYAGPCILHGRMVITNTTSYSENKGAFDLLDGSPVMIDDPVTGDPVPWRFTRTYGCNTAVASENLLTFRSGAAGFYDLANHGGTGNFGGFKSGCTANLIIADGVLNAPDYTRTCTCGYQNQTSLALVPMAENEYWTYSLLGKSVEGSATIRRLGVNLGAPGDRLSDDGTLWVNYPADSGASPQIGIDLDGDPNWFVNHSGRISGGSLPWVAASGVEGIRTLAVHLVSRPEGKTKVAAAPTEPSTDPVGGGRRRSGDAGPGIESEEEAAPRHFTVRLVFVEPDAHVKPQDRVFDVAVQGQQVVSGLDPTAEAGGPLRPVIRTCPDVAAGDTIQIELTARSQLPPVLCGVEIIEHAE